MKLQELANSISREIANENLRRRRAGDYDYFGTQPSKAMGQKMLEQFEYVEEMKHTIEEFRQDSSGSGERQAQQQNHADHRQGERALRR